MLKKLFSRYKIPLLEAYLAASVCFLGSGMTWIGIAVVIGFVNTYLLNPLIVTFKFGNRQLYPMPKRDHFKLIKNVGIALLISTIIVFIYSLINKYLFATFVEPITFGILYKVIDIGIRRLYSYRKTNYSVE